jgi:hypothetical protein
MFSTSRRLRWSVPALACALGLGGAAAAQTIVISSAGPSARSYPSGKSLAAGSRIVLAAGDTLTLLDSKGTRTLRGPIATSAEAAATRANTSFAMLVATQNRRRPRTGAIRGASEPAKPINLWDVDTSTSGTVCVVNPATVLIWRADATRAATVAVTSEAGGNASVSFPDKISLTAWPASLPIAEGRTYVLSGGGLARPAHVRFALLATPPSDPASTYAALDAKGCEAQKTLLLNAMKPVG